MRASTRIFGEIEIEDDKIICFENGMIGFPEMKKFTLIYNEEKNKDSISWLQSMDDPEVAFPVIDPLLVYPDYNPTVEDDMFTALGEATGENLFVLVTVTVPSDIEQIAVNLKAPIVINTDTLKARQIIVEDDMPVKYKIYDQLKAAKQKAGE